MRDYFTQGISRGVSPERVQRFKSQTKKPESRVFFHSVVSKVVYIGGIGSVVIVLLLSRLYSIG